MYAVGGNAEAAAVSGINVFAVTMGIFIMAGIFYGCGAFLEAFRANASAGTGQGFELDAIAACVVGGISFNGGIGKIRGAVLGVIIFTGHVPGHQRLRCDHHPGILHGTGCTPDRW